MARFVLEIMNKEILSAHLDEDAQACLTRVLSFGVSGVPVLDDEGRVCGVASWRDLVGATGPLKEHMSCPPATVGADGSIEGAALLMAHTGHHRLIVIDEDSRPLGVISTIDVLRGLTGTPAQHPSAFHHLDKQAPLKFTDAYPLNHESLGQAPSAAGVLALIHSETGEADRVVWAEACASVRSRVKQLLTADESLPGYVLEWQRRGVLYFKTAETGDGEAQMQALHRVLKEAKRSRQKGVPE